MVVNIFFFSLVVIALYDSRSSELLVVLNRRGAFNRPLISVAKLFGLFS